MFIFDTKVEEILRIRYRYGNSKPELVLIVGLAGKPVRRAPVCFTVLNRRISKDLYLVIVKNDIASFRRPLYVFPAKEGERPVKKLPEGVLVDDPYNLFHIISGGSDESA